MAGMLEGVAVLKCSSQTQVKTTQDMQREVWNSSPSSVLKVSVMAGMLEGVAVLKCSSQSQVQATAGAQSKAINTITHKLSSSFWPRHEFPFWGLEKPRVTRPHGSSLHVHSWNNSMSAHLPLTGAAVEALGQGTFPTSFSVSHNLLATRKSDLPPIEMRRSTSHPLHGEAMNRHRHMSHYQPVSPARV